jgi:hypothetical protein
LIHYAVPNRDGGTKDELFVKLKILSVLHGKGMEGELIRHERSLEAKVMNKLTGQHSRMGCVRWASKTLKQQMGLDVKDVTTVHRATSQMR